MRNALVIAAIVAAAVVCAVIPPPASAMRFGVEDDSVLLQGWWGDPDLMLHRSRQIHAGTVRIVLPWRDVETTPGSYDWAKADLAVNRARSYGMKVLLTLGGTPVAPPSWQGTLPNPNLSGYQAFVSAAAQHFAGRVREWTLYNEPNWARVPARHYRLLFIGGRHAIKRVLPHARVYFADVAGGSLESWLRRVLSYGRVHSEGFAWHPYQFVRSPDSDEGGRRASIGIGRTPQLRALLKRLAQRHLLTTDQGHSLPLYATEFGYLTHGPYAARVVAPEWWPRALRQARQSGVRLLIAYQMFPEGRNDVDWDTSILNADGSATPTFRSLERPWTR